VDIKVEETILQALIGKSSPKQLETLREHLRQGNLENRMIKLNVVPGADQNLHNFLNSNDPQNNLLKMISSLGGPQRAAKKKMTIGEARPLIEAMETQRQTDTNMIIKDAIRATEQDGIVFIDEIDKICNPQGRGIRHGSDASDEGVQKDLLPIIEGSIISTKHGNVDTEKILFICSGAFHNVKPSDLISELQGRLPIRVELKPLTEKDFYRILTEPENNLIKQQILLLNTEGVVLTFRDEAIREIARMAYEVNSQVENIGARRLHTIIERIVEEISFNCDSVKDAVIDVDLVKNRIAPMLTKTDLSRFIL